SKNTEESTSISKGELKNGKMQSGDNKESSPAVQSNKNNLQNNEGRSDHSPAKMERSRLDKDCINVVFHALLTPTFNFQPGYNKVVLRGNSPFSWHPGRQLEMRVGREVWNGYFILEGKAKLTLQDAHYGVSYKYAVLQPNGKELWECLIGFKPRVSGHVNRLLVIPESSIKGNTTWHQYDDAVFSEPGLWESLCSHFPPLRSIVRDPVEGRRMAMFAMLPELDSIFADQKGERLTAHATLAEINKILHCMLNCACENGGFRFIRDLIGFDAKKVLWEYLSPRLNQNIQSLQVHTKDEYLQNKRLVTAAIIASLVGYHEMTFLRDEVIKDLLECLTLNGDPYRRRSSGLNAILHHFPQMEHLSKVASSLCRICNYVIETRPGIYHWLFAVPLLHFLSEVAAPYSGELSSAPSSIKDDTWWGAQEINFQSVWKRAELMPSSTPINLLIQLTPMFEVDPLFKRTFLLALPICDLGKALERNLFELHEVCWTLARVVEERDPPFLSQEEWASLENTISQMCLEVEAYAGFPLLRKKESTYEAMMSLAQAAFYLLHHLFSVHGLAIRKESQVISGIFQLLAKSLQLAKRGFVVYTSSKEADDSCQDIFQRAVQSLLSFLDKNFRESLFYALRDLRQEEFQVWSTLLSVMIEEREFQVIWEHGVREALKRRINLMEKKHIVELFCELDLNTYHQEIGESFMAASFQAVDCLCLEGLFTPCIYIYSISLHYNRLRHTEQDSGARKLLGLFLRRCWPKGDGGKEPSRGDQLRYILSWEPMAKYFQCFGGDKLQGVALPDDGLDLLLSAFGLLEHVGLGLRTAEIDAQTIRIVEKHSECFLRLYSLVSHDKDKRHRSEGDESKKDTSPEKIFLDMRIEELKAFEKEREAVRCFVQMCTEVKSVVDVDVAEIKEKLDKDPLSCQLSEMCYKRSAGEEPIVKFFGLSAMNKRMIQSLYCVQGSILFVALWQKCVQRAADISKDKGINGGLTIDNVCELVWTPSYRRWQDLWMRIISGEIRLKEVKEQFGRFVEDQKLLDAEIETTLACFSDKEGVEESDLYHRIDQIKQSLKLSECSDAAEVVLLFKNEMGLEGDFQGLEDFHDQIEESFDRRTLDTISEGILEMGKDLEQLAREKIDCLKTVIKCKEYIFWLREELKGGREEVKTLVDLAMMSAGESDIETDRVSFLHTTALGFAPFIFDLKKDVGFCQLIRIFDAVWKEIEENKSLPKKLEGITEHLEWLKGVKDAHAMSSLELAQKINERGVYCVGQLDTTTTLQPSDKKTVDSVVNLVLPLESNSNATFREYSLGKLQELQSKLALISGKRSTGQDDVDKFNQILQGVVRLGQAYVKLCEIGDVSYLDWNKEYKCKTSIVEKDVINDITSQAQEFERRYYAYRVRLHEQRMRYRELNYFTTQQLLFLRKELAAIKRRANIDFLNFQVFALLEKIAPGISPSTLKGVLIEAGVMQDSSYSDDRVLDQQSLPGSHVVDYHQTADEQVEVEEKFERLLKSVEKLNYPEAERLTLAALEENWQSSEADLVFWCVQNKADDALIDRLCDEAKKNPLFRVIVKEVTGLESSESAEDSDEEDVSESGDNDYEVAGSSTSEEISFDEQRGGSYLALEEVAVFLSHLASNDQRTATRLYPRFLKNGRPNLILAPKENIFPAVLSLYMEGGAQNLPDGNEVLVCTSTTTAEEVELLWRRALTDPEGKFYCLVMGDLLDYDVSQKAVDCLHTLMGEYNNEYFGLVVLCSSENEERAQMVAALEEYKVTGIPRYPKPAELRRYLRDQFTAPEARQGCYHDKRVIWTPASDTIRSGNLNVRLVTSTDSGVGKSLVVQGLAEQVSNLPNNLLISEEMEEQNQDPLPVCVTIPLHDERAGVADITDFFLPHAIHPDVPLSRIFHLDSSCKVIPDLDTLLFNLLILGELTDNRGRVWRRNPYDFYILEITYTPPQNEDKTSCRFFELFPTITCLRPAKILKRKVPNESPLFDDEEFRSEAIQRVWQYLRRFNEDPGKIKDFEFVPQRTEGNPMECLEELIRLNCGVHNPSWFELRQFVNFLNHQLLDCEKSVYCKPEFTEDTLEGFRIFVVRFMIIMSKDFSMRSLKETDETGMQQTDDESDIRPLQLRRSWEQSTHPYLFFNPDHETLSFLGFKVDEDGNAEFLDPQTGEIVQKRLMPRRLRTGLHVQKVDLNHDFESKNKREIMETLCKVMGLEWGMIDPDKSYELTGDNAKKILAIHMRFRCDIPVIIMGETGCGKTRLIRYMCGLQTGGMKCKNLLLMKIHGGTTFKDIERNVVHAEEMAVRNAQLGFDTVLFFDEANTTEALGMIKEIMIDRRCNGRPLSLKSNRLKFIVACNPYRKHTDEMIKKLESAGLGYRVRADETTERIGEIPLRQLVYRVHALPESMRSLVWDFGRLQPDVEEKYICQIVKRYVKEQHFQGDDDLVETIARILSVSQQFMGKRKDECSFVSLRDVKRAMEVMVWFHKHYKYFAPLLQSEEQESIERRESEQDEDDKEETSNVHSFRKKVELFDEMHVPQEKLSDSRIPFPDDELLFVNGTSASEERHSESGVSLPVEEMGDSANFTEVIKPPLANRETRISAKASARSFTCPSYIVLPFACTAISLYRIFNIRNGFMPASSMSISHYIVWILFSGVWGKILVVFAANSHGYACVSFSYLLQPQETLGDDLDPITWSLILALGVCYQARLQNRDEYRQEVAKVFSPPCRLPGGPDRIETEITRCQQAVMKKLKLGPNIARNTALSENVFMMLVCIELRIPLFVVGKPGSSKSLAKTVVADNMQGEQSTSELFKNFKQIQLISYQCSPQSTPEGIMATFQQCSELQDRKRAETFSDKFASVVVLDEVGLAEDSPKMPLKTLHPLLEDSDKTNDDVIETEESFSRVAFIGLSNWALDPAKMNRGIMLSRGEPCEDELEETARGICGSDSEIMPWLEDLIPPLVTAYSDLYQRQKNIARLQHGKKDEFFGLRDFYSLVKMVFHIAKKQRRSPNWQELEDAIKRNFGGLLEEDFVPVKIIKQHLGFPPEFLQGEEDHLGLDNLGLIRDSLRRESLMGEGRYLLIMTENFAALPRIKQLLLELDKEEPYVIFGSSFPKDQLFTQARVCRNINRVKICMETGRTVILLNLDNLYESLYDALNQYYVTFGGEKYVDLGLGNHRVKCRVHEDFRLIVIAEKDEVYNRFPIPLINRMEKHFLVMSSGLTEAQKNVTKELQAWVEEFADVFRPLHERQSRTFTKGDAFIGYHEDCVPAVVLQVCAESHEDGSDLSDVEREAWEEKILRCSQERLLQCATPDSVTRLNSSRLKREASNLWTKYFREQEHSSLANFLVKALKEPKLQATKEAAIRAQISTHSRLLSDRDITSIAEAAGLPEGCVKCVSLQQFQTEQQFCNCIGREFFAILGGREGLLIVQCDSTDRTLDLVACARHLLIEECRETEKELDQECIGSIHILMIVQLARVAGGCPDFVAVQGEGWLSVHIDELCPPSEEIPPIEAMTGRSVSRIFEGALNKTEDNFTVRQVLTSCVQEAASRIEDDNTTLGRATKRVELMVSLLSTKTSTTREGSFEAVLAERVYQLLQERDQRAPNKGNDWLENEALSTTTKETGTFKKALWRRFQSVVAPFLAELIAYVDRDGNLDLAASEDGWIVNLWLKVLRDSSFTYLEYNDFLVQKGDALVLRRKVPVQKSGYRSHSFQCKLPFSWLLKECMDELLRDARSIAVNSNESTTECMRRLVNNSEVHEILSKAISDGGEAVADRYLHDFAHMTYAPQEDDELEVVLRAIVAAAKEMHSERSTGRPFELDLAAIHTAHSRIRQRLTWLSQLLHSRPDILPELCGSFSWDENEMCVDACALQMSLESLEPQKEDFSEPETRREWCDEVLSLKVPVEAMIVKAFKEGPPVGHKTEAILTQCRYMWQRLSAVRMFIENVYPSQINPDVGQTILKLWKALGERTDFSKKSSLDVLERFLLSCSEDSFQQHKENSLEGHAQFLHRCNTFFVDIVSVFCFGEDIPKLDTGVFEMLMRYAVGEELTETKPVSPFPRFGMDNSPVVRSFLLQHLINSSYQEAKRHLERFLYKAQGLSSEAPHVLNVCLLVVQCMENFWASDCARNSDLELKVTIRIVDNLCQDALKILARDLPSSDELQVSPFEAVAKTRYALSKTAEFMYMRIVSDDEKWSNYETSEALNSLFNTVQELCTSVPSRSLALFLLKQLVKRYGVNSIATVSQNEDLFWIVPAEFRQIGGDGMTLDRFLVYGDYYHKLRDSLASAILSENMDDLIASLEALDGVPGHAKDVTILLALYREVGMSEEEAQNQQLRSKVLVENVLKRGKYLSESATRLARSLLENSAETNFPFLPILESQKDIGKALSEVLIHTTSVFECIDFDKLLEPLSAILLSPRKILDSFLPTMPEDNFDETSSAMKEGGQWYECPAGHRYFVGDCGRPYEQRSCPYCPGSVTIGGEKHVLAQANRLANRRDRSNKGHILGVPQKSVAERGLSPATVSLLRVILHSAMLVSACREPEAVRQLIAQEVPEDGVCGFLWEHLVNDVQSLSASLDRSEDDVLLTVHLVLSEIVWRATNSNDLLGFEKMSFWSTKEERKKWENDFVTAFVGNILMDLGEGLRGFYAKSVNDRRLGNDPLIREVYEVDEPSLPRTVADIYPGHAVFWRYRTRVTVELVIRNFQDVESNKTTHKILGRFLDEEHKLRALQFLPDIVALQRKLNDRFHRRIERERADPLTVRDFLKGLHKEKDSVRKLFQSFQSAWELVRHQLSSQGRFAPTKEQCEKTMERSSSVSLLIPTSEGPGVCCKGLMFFLVNAHNELVQAYGSLENTR
ncbi:unnamed protein product, partial [Porites evermanni]